MSRLSIVIFGATGFTGKYAVCEMVRLSKMYPGITWGVAGRNQSKLESLMQDVAKRTGEDQSHIKIIIADVSDEASLNSMCAQAKVIANCCGPYRLYGEQVVKAAVEQGTHHVDITGEPQFIESMQLKYSERAKEAGVYVISACGFDSIPNDMGTVFLQQQFGGTLNSVESYLSSTLPSDLRKRALKEGSIHYGTWESLVYGLAHYDELKPLRMKLYPDKMPTLEPKLQKRWVIHQREGWCVPFPGADNSIVYRTQRALHAPPPAPPAPPAAPAAPAPPAPPARPAQFRAYVRPGGWPHAALLLLAGAALYILTRFAFSRRLMLAYPRIFSFGMVSHEGPSDVVMENTKYQFVLYGEGWEEGTDVKEKPNKRVVAKVSGKNPGYGATVSALLFSAITILDENDKIPGKGGVLTTGVAFRDTSLVQHLSSSPENNMKFEIIESTRI